MVIRLAISALVLAAFGSSAFAAEGGDRPLTKMTLPLEATTKKGAEGGPINLVFVAAPGRVEAALDKAGWARADKTTPHTAVKIAKDVVTHQAYPNAPVSPSYLFGRKQDEAWEKEVNDPRVRDHLRLWDSGQHDAQGRHFYAVDASKDVAVGHKPHSPLPTHKIDPDVDREAATLIADLQKAGQVKNVYALPGLGPVHKHDSVGNPYFTQGKVQVVVLD